ncbi:MAG: CBS domain-containing protein [Candidatus Hadarchaeum sp.]|uniref:CBS domain-containing protein n=1 Tax=Candidatus Hadarchaeum sp. TaxID=2883567 RepID=UPI003D0CB3FA
MRRMPHYKSLDRGPVDFKSRVHRKEGDIMTIAKKPVVSVTQTMRIKNAVDLMVKEGIRRLPVTEPGSKRLVGVVRTRDILEFLGGGEKFNIIKVKFGGNFLAAINEPVRVVMERDLTYGTSRMSITEVARLILDKGVGGVPILDDDGKIVGIVSEHDFLRFVPEETGAKVSYYMSRHVVTAESSFRILDAARTIVSRGFRRLPVLSGGRLVGIVTSMDILRYLSSNRIFDHLSSERFEDAMSISVGEIMTREVVKAAPEMDVGEAAGIMHQRGCGGLPVVSGEELLGIITEHDLMRLLL